MNNNNTDRLVEIRGKAIAAANDLRILLPEQVDYAGLVCAEGFAHGQHYVWTDPEPYAMDAAAKSIDVLLSEIDRLTAENAEARESCDETCCFACKFDCDTSITDSGCYANECPGFERDDCFEWRGPDEKGETHE